MAEGEHRRGLQGGARIAVELAPGSDFAFRRAHVTADAPALQATDATAAALGQRVGALQVSAGGEGALPGDRLGIRESIVGRMARAGGSATVRPGAGGSGTEVHLRLPAGAER